MRHGRRQGGTTVVAALVGMCVLAGCSSTPGPAAGRSTASVPRSMTTTTSGPSSITTTRGSVSAVLAAYRPEWAAFEQALADANPGDPRLAATMVDPQLQSVKGNLLADQRQGMVGRGTFTLHPKVTVISATSATVVDCACSTAELVDKATGKPVPPVPRRRTTG